MVTKMEQLEPREKILLSLLKAFGKSPMSPLQIMKSLFLYSQKRKPKGFYEFVPYLYGPCSFDVYLDLRELVSKGLIAEIPSHFSWNFYTITSNGEKILKDEKQDDDLEDIKKFVLSKSFVDLLKYIYTEYPEFAVNSIFNKEALEKL